MRLFLYRIDGLKFIYLSKNEVNGYYTTGHFVNLVWAMSTHENWLDSKYVFRLLRWIVLWVLYFFLL